MLSWSTVSSVPLANIGLPVLAAIKAKLQQDLGSSPVELQKEWNSLAARSGLYSWTGNLSTYGLHSSLCSGVAQSGEACCTACQGLQRSRVLAQRGSVADLRQREYISTRAAGNEVPPSFWSGVRAGDMGRGELLERLQSRAVDAKATRRREDHREEQVVEQKAIVSSLRGKLEEALQRADLPAFVQLFEQAHREGKLANKAAVVDLLQGIAEAIVKGRRHRNLSPTQKAFYACLLNNGGPYIAQLVAANLEGPDIRTMKRHRAAAAFKYGLNFSAEAVKQVAAKLRQYGLLGAPCILSEDASALQTRLEAVVEGGGVWVYGMCNGAYPVTSVENLRQLYHQHGMATQLYVHTLVPLVPDAQHIPLLVTVHDGTKKTFTPKIVRATWEKLWRACEAEDIRVVGTVSDGDGRLRQSSLSFMLKRLQEPNFAGISVAHPLIQLVMPLIGAGPKLATQDPLHLMWRGRVIMLSVAKQLYIGRFRVNFANDVESAERERGEPLGLLFSDTNPKDKQNYLGALRCFDFKVDGKGVVHEVTTLRDALSERPEYFGTFLYITFFHTFCRPFFVKGMMPIEVVRDAAWCISFLAYWQRCMLDLVANDVGGARLRSNFLTQETMRDLFIACNSVILSVVYHRGICEETGHFVEFCPYRMSSRFSEYVFQHLRSFTSTSSKFTVLSALQQIGIYGYQLDLEVSSDVHVPASKRGAPRGQVRVHESMSESREGYYPSDTVILETIEESLCEVVEVLKDQKECLGKVTSVWNSLAGNEARKKNIGNLVMLGDYQPSPAEAESEGGEDAAPDEDDELMAARPSTAGLHAPEGEEEVEAEGSTAQGALSEDVGDSRVNTAVQHVFGLLTENGSLDLASTVEPSKPELVLLLSQVRQVLHQVNSAILKQSDDRTMGRFFSPEVVDAVGTAVCVWDDPEYLVVQDDFAALFEHGDGSLLFYIGNVFSLGSGEITRRSAKRVKKLSRNDPSGWVRAKWYKFVKSGAVNKRHSTGELLLELDEWDFGDGMNEVVKCEAIVACVTLRQVRVGGKDYFTLAQDDEVAVLEYLRGYEQSLQEERVLLPRPTGGRARMLANRGHV